MIDLARFGDAPAIETADGRIVSYRELDALVDRHAHAGLVEVPAERSVDFIARCLGAWRGGGAFIPVDPTDPRPRRPAKARLAAIDACGLAYAITTSGSTGTPKTVHVGPHGLPTLWRTQVDAFALGPGARSLWLYSPLFDASISDWGCALSSGATLVLPTDRAMTRISDELATRAITHVDLPPQLLADLTPPPSLRVVILGGEACEVSRVKSLARTLRVVVVYGPTEATVCSSLVVVDPDRWTRPLIGNPLPDITYRVIDGELHIAGPALALGYDDPAETARRFITIDNTRFYRTGDRVEPTPHGLAFVGRTDRQIKLRGRRIELDEVELALRRFCDAAVLVHRDRIVAFVERPVDRTAIALPPWMRPSRFVVGPLPRTPTGKIDRAALVVPPPRPTDPLALAWCHALGVDDVADTDRFDGDSLARLMLLSATDIDIVGTPTFAELRTLAACTVCAKTQSDFIYAQLVRTVRPPDKESVASGGFVDPARERCAEQITGSYGIDVGVDADVRDSCRAGATDSVVEDTNVVSGGRTSVSGGSVFAASSGASASENLSVFAESSGVSVSNGLSGASVPRELVSRSASRALSVAECEARGLLEMSSAARRAAKSDTDGSAASSHLDPTAKPSADLAAAMSKRPCSEGGAVLITGAAGFLGRALIAAWRQHHPGQHIIGLVRGEIWRRGSGRGDIEIDQLGIEIVRADIAAIPDELHARVATVVHCAATIQLGGDWDAHEHANVRGTAEVARFAAGMPWHHVSTLSVFVNTDHGRGRHRPGDLPRGVAYGGYAQTKIAAEAIARASGASIYRLGLLVGGPDDDAGRSDQLAMTMRALAKLGAAPAGFRDERYDATPVAFAADAIARLAANGGTHHVSAGSVRFGDVLERMTIDEVPYDMWLERARAAGDDPDVAMAIGAFSRRPELDLFLATHAEFS